MKRNFPVKKTRLPKEIRKALLITAAVQIANERGLQHVTWESVGGACKPKTTGRNVRDKFKRIPVLWKAVSDDKRSCVMVRDEAIAMGL